MTRNVLESVNRARNFFEIKDFPGNLYLKKLIQDGKLSREDIKKTSFRNKDLGECELLAIAKASSGQYWIVTNDKGRVFQHPDQNLFDTYANDPDVILLTGEAWLNQIGFSENNEHK